MARVVTMVTLVVAALSLAVHRAVQVAAGRSDSAVQSF